MRSDILEQLPGSIIEVSGTMRSVRRSPAGHDLATPQTYAAAEHSRDERPRYAATKVRGDGGVDYVSLASRQALATDIERVLVEEAGLPDIVVDFGAGEIIGLPDLPHRIYDAYLRYGVDQVDENGNDGEPWEKTKTGAALDAATPRRAGAVYTHAPTALLLGGWRSFKDAGRVRWVHAVGAEVAASDALIVEGGAVRQDPRQLRAAGIALDTDAEGQLIVATGRGKRLSKLGFGTTPTSGRVGVEIRGGIVATGILDGITLSRLGGLDEAAIQALCGYGLWALLRTLGRSMSLRSGCILVPAGEPELSLDGDALDAEHPLRNADTVLEAARAARDRSATTMRDGTITVYPSAAVRRKIESMRTVAADEAEGAEAESD